MGGCEGNGWKNIKNIKSMKEHSYEYAIEKNEETLFLLGLNEYYIHDRERGIHNIYITTNIIIIYIKEKDSIFRFNKFTDDLLSILDLSPNAENLLICLVHYSSVLMYFKDFYKLDFEINSILINKIEKLSNIYLFDNTHENYGSEEIENYLTIKNAIIYCVNLLNTEMFTTIKIDNQHDI